MTLPSRRMLNLVWRWAIMRIKPEDRAEWIREMEMPLNLIFEEKPKAKGTKPQPTPEELQADKEAFLAAMSGR